MRTVFALLFALAFSAQAGDSVPVSLVARVQSDTEESVLRAGARVMLAHTRETSTEACARICRAPGGTFQMTVITNGSHLGCMPVDCEAGEVSGEILHSHPAHLSRFRPNSADLVFLGKRGQAGGQMLRNSTRHGFSDVDYAAGPGYMIDVDGVIWHQAGRGAVRKVETISP